MMNKSLLVGVVVGVGIATASAVVAFAMRDNNAQEIAAGTAMTPASEPAVADTGVVIDVPAAEAQAVVAEDAAPAPALTPVAVVAAAPVPAALPAKKKGQPKKSAPAAQTAAATPAPAAAPAEHCWDEEVTHTADPKDDNRIAGTAIGAVVGGVIGNQFGGGKGKKLATVAGAAGGAYAGNRAQKAVQDKNTYTTVEHHCEPVQ